MENMEEGSYGQEQTMEPLIDHHSQIKSIQDLSQQVYELNLKIEQLSNPSSIHTTPGIEFPKFTGEDFNGWIYKCDHFFQVYNNIPDETKVRMASIHMEGAALHWHTTKFASTTDSNLGWDEYVQIIRTRFGVRSKKSTPQIENTKKPRRRICRLQQNEDDDEPKKFQFHFRFGPIYYSKEDDSSSSSSSAKKKAWEHLLKNSPNRAAVTTESYLSAVRLIEKEARNCYADGEADWLTGSQFRWMMILDGSFFLQLALYLLGGSQQLGYPLDDPIFGKNSNYTSRFRDVKDWIEAMFFVGNQIPLVVLKELIKQSYFQRVVKEGKWEQPLDLSRRALYELLLLPEIEAHRPKSLRTVKDLWGKVFVSKTLWLQQQEPTDLIHGLQLMVLGPQLDHTTEDDEDEDEDDDDEDLESQHVSIDSSSGAVDDKISSSAIDLKQGGIHFLLSTGTGTRGIRFTNSMFFCHGYAILHMPPISINEDTELVFSCLREYEISQKLSMSKREICSYLRFMSELIRTPDDAKLMASKNIVQGNLKYKHKLPGILRGLASKDTYNQNLRLVKLKIGDYSSPIWKKYWHIISFGLIITVLQTVYTVLPYYKG